MRTIKSLTEIRDEGDQSALYITIGNFDGVHRGHSEFIHEIKKVATETCAKLVAITFVPHPNFIIRPSDYFLINSYEERRTLLENIGIDYLYEIDFDRDFSTLLPTVFLDKFILVDRNISGLFFGHDFVFGSNKSGGHDLAADYCRSRGVELTILEKFLVKGERVSSSLVRDLIRAGDVKKAAGFLGRNYHISGTVIRGMGRGRELGYSTANINYSKDIVIPSNGVYCTQTTYKGITYSSITNVGLNPTFNDITEVSIETHLLDFNRDIYGETISVSFIHRIRDERKFNSRAELVAQIKADVKRAKL
ncbi:MAG: bifunctional riboflavin kinase/FAD synthetase [Bacteriovoracaceae bacterium]|nr:bifunctional riboflavin kinase/FAD synthetase [Bacteriovoracaceae bacterium]